MERFTGGGKGLNEVIERKEVIVLNVQIPLRVLWNQKISSLLVWQCLDELQRVTDLKTVKLIWVQSHQEIHGNGKLTNLLIGGQKSNSLDQN